MSNYYIARTSDQILEEMLKSMPDEYLKTVGTFTYDLNKTYALQGAEYDKRIEELWNFFDIHRLKNSELDKRVLQLQGLKRKEATYAVGEVTVTGIGTIIKGDLFETKNAVQFKAAETVEIINVGNVKIEAVKAGETGNVGAKAIILMPVTIQGIKSVINEKATYDGFDAETDESLLDRYDIKVQMPATSGNVYHYMQWAREISGVGNSKVFPLWNGKNTVKVVIINDMQQPASIELVEKVQNYIDPKGKNNDTWGCGMGEAPIGAYCTVKTATPKKINISITLKKEEGIELDILKERIKQSVIEFLQSIAFKKDYVSYALISNAILETSGVIEWSELKINNEVNNILIGEEEVAVLEDVVLNE